MRIYVPATWPMLKTLVKTGVLDPIGGTAFALTPGLRESDTSGDDEFGLGEDSTPARRVVVSADLENVTLRPDLDDGAVRIAGCVPFEAIAAVHVDTEEAAYAVREAAGAVDAADLGDLDAEFLVGEAEDHELAWYNPSEVAFLVEGQT